jgi:hypothetical protein
MKGFIYLIEIAVAAILMTVVLTVFFSIRIKQDWQKSDLIATGNNILSSIKGKDNFFLNILNENLTDIEENKPENIKYGLNVYGSPKSKIYIGCPINYDYLKGLLNSQDSDYGSVFVNGRWINFTVEQFDINSGIPYYDAIVLINYTNYSNNIIKSYLNSYLSNGGVVIGINATINGTDADFKSIFNLTYVSGASSYPVNFTFYNPYIDDISKYFLGIGMGAYSDWYMWEQQWHIDYWGSNKINITNSSDSSINRTNLVEGSIFNLTGPNSNKYFFKVKKLWYPDRVDFQILNKTFVFKDFSEKNITGNNIVGNISTIYAALTTNNSAVWISDFPKSDEYRTLVKAAILSRVDRWTVKGVYTSKEKTTISSFASLCCDMPETAELYLTLWYEI